MNEAENPKSVLRAQARNGFVVAVSMTHFGRLVRSYAATTGDSYYYVNDPHDAVYPTQAAADKVAADIKSSRNIHSVEVQPGPMQEADEGEPARPGHDNPMQLQQWSDLQLSNLARTKRNMPGEETLGGIEQKRQTSLEKIRQLRKGLADRPELHGQIDDLEAKMAHHANLIGKLRYSMEYRHELKRMGLTTQDIQAAIPSRDTRHGQVPAFIVGVVDNNGDRHLFLRPVRVRR